MESKLIPGEALIYERDDRGTVYARYRDPPNNSIPRWVVGGPVDSSHPLLGYATWQELIELSNKNVTLRKQLNKLTDLFFILKKENNNNVKMY